MKTRIYIVLLMLISNLCSAQQLVSDVTAQANQLFIAKDEMVTNTETLLGTLENLGVSKELLTSAQEVVKKMQKVNTKIKTSKQVYNMILYSSKIINTYYKILTSTSGDSNNTPGEIAIHTSNLYALLVRTLDMTDKLTSLLTDSYYEMSDAERLAYLDDISNELTVQYYQLQYYALRLASNSASRSITIETLEYLNVFFNF